MEDSKISEEEVKRIAELSRLKLDDESAKKRFEEFNEILSYFSQIAELKGQGRPIFNEINAIREDEVKEFDNQSGIIANFYKKQERYLKAPKAKIK